jgi:delta8-fatty-acid desaturase
VEDEEFDGMTFLESETRKEIKLDLDRYPSLDDATQDDIVRKYRLLHERIKEEGLFQCNYTAYAIECTRYALLFAGFLYFLHRGWWATSAVFLGCFWHQLVFSAHDAGHMGITHDFHTDSVIGIIIADFFGGLSLGWWKRNHNVHHIVTNFPEHDPDIEHMPFFAVSHRLLGSLRSTYYDKVMEYDAAAKFFIAIQHYSYYFILLFGRFNLYRLSFDYLLMGRAPKRGLAWWHWWLEMAGQVVFWTWFGYGVVYKSIPTAGARIVFILVSHAITAPLHLQITLSHFAMSTADLGPNESFPQKMLRTTMDVDCPQWLDFIHGGLQFQAIHHLYPRIPRHNLRRTQKLVQEFCDDVGIPYALYGFVGGNKEVIGRLAQVSRQAAILAKCQRSLVVGEGGHGHAHHY